MADAYAPIDVAVLEAIADRYRTDELVAEVDVALGESEGHRRLTVELDSDRYPAHVAQSRIEVQWYRNDGFNVHYVETHADGNVWQCRWDRQRNPHNDHEHFHRPPDGAGPVDVEYPEDSRDVLSAIRVVIGDRIEALWESRES